MQKLKMGDWGVGKTEVPIRTIQSSTWIRGPKSGIADIHIELGQPVSEGTPLATISDAFGAKPRIVKAPWAGWVIATTQNPLINRGDSLVHIAAKKGATVRRPS